MHNIDKQLALLEELRDKGMIGQGTYLRKLLELSKLKIIAKDFPRTADKLSRKQKLDKAKKNS